MNAKPFLTLNDVAEQLGVSRRTIHNLIQDEALPVVQLRGRRWVPTTALAEWIATKSREAVDRRPAA